MRTALVALATVFLLIVPRAMAQDREDCILDEPKAIFKNAGFRYDKSTGTWQEKISLSKDVSVRVQVIQCESVERKWTFETKPDPDLVKGFAKSSIHYDRAIDLLSQLEAYPKAKVQPAARSDLAFGDVKTALRAYINLVADPTLGTEIVFRRIRDGGFSESVTIHYVHKARTDADLVEVTLRSGPY